MAAISQDQFSHLIKTYSDRLFRTANCILKNGHDAEDAVCEAIYKAFLKLHALRDGSSFKSWMYRIVINESYTLLRKRKNTVNLDEADEIAAPESEGQWLMDYVNKLPHDMRMPVYLFYYEDMSLADISRVLAIAEGTVKSRLRRARERLRTIIPVEEVQHGF